MNQSSENNKTPANIEFFPSVQRKMIIEGKMIPAIICNGGYYAFTNLSIYSDGIIDSWGAVDLEFFAKKLRNRWVSTSMPDGEKLSIHHLGRYSIKNGKWDFTPQKFYDYVLGILQELNPKLENLYNFHGTDVVIKNKVKHAKISGASGTPFYKMKVKNYWPKVQLGDSFYLFKKIDKGSFYLVRVIVYEDQTVSINHLPKPEKMSIEQFKAQVKNQEVQVDLPEGAKVKIHGLGEFEVGDVNHAGVRIESVVDEMEDMVATLNGTPTRSQKCYEIYQAYVETPTTALRDELKESYEAVPGHLRRYVLGDMDRKDIPIRMIIYGKDEINNWSHHIVAEQEGHELPKIDIPEVEDEGPEKEK